MTARLTERDKLMQRMLANAEQFQEAYPTSAALLKSAMAEAMPWAMPLYSSGRTPNKLQLERLGTQILAILLASLPPEAEPASPAPVPDPMPEGASVPAGWGQARQAGGAKLHSFK